MSVPRACILSLVLGAGVASAQVTLDVPATYPTIADALVVAAPGDTVLVAPGTYFESDLTFGGKDLTLKSAAGPEVTILDAQTNGRLFVFDNFETAAAVLEGFTLQNGRAPVGAPGIGSGSGADGEHGGAILVDTASPQVVDCIFRWNVAGAGGAGAKGQDGEDGKFSQADAWDGEPGTPGGNGGLGGAIYAFAGSPHIDGCVFLSNSAGRGGAGGPGGAGGEGYEIWPSSGDGGDGGPGGLGRMGGDGGAIATDDCAAWIRSCLFLDNHAGQSGAGGPGGPGGDGDNHGSPGATGSTETPGVGGALSLDDLGSEVNGCTILDGTASQGGAVHMAGGSLFNSILRGCLPNQISGAPLVEHSNVEGIAPTLGNIDADPLFVDAVGGDLRLSAGSPCINAGDQLLGTPWAFDLAGVARVVALETDMGAHEYDPAYPGTFEDLVLLTQVAGVGDPLLGSKSALGGDLLTVGLDSPGLTFAWQKPMLALQAYATGGSLPSSAGLPDVHVNGALPGLTLIDLGGSPVGPVLLPPGGLLLGFVVPPGLVGTTVRIQGFVISPLASNGLYATTDAHEVLLL